MLFSSAAIAEYVNAQFEPAWVSVRPVPIVTIDFGNGHTITRTLHGNIATSVCDAQGRVLDVLPGIYQPEEYLRQLHQLGIVEPQARFFCRNRGVALLIRKGNPLGIHGLVDAIRPGMRVALPATGDVRASGSQLPT